MSNTLNSREAVLGFAGWLTTRDEITTMSARHDAAPIAALVENFCGTNNLPDVTEGWAENILQDPKEDK